MNQSPRPLLAAVMKLAVFPTSNSSTTTCSISLSGHLMGL